MTLRIGHRGAPGYEPENTLASFKKALDLGVDMIELDVYVCAGGELVVFHDDTLFRMAGVTGIVYRKELSYLKTLDLGNGETVPTLEEVFDLVAGKAAINIELKGRGTARPVMKTIQSALKTGTWNRDQFLVSSFNHDELRDFRSLDKKTRIGILSDKRKFDYTGTAGELKAYSAHPATGHVTPELVRKLHSLGLKVFVWTANSYSDIRYLKNSGVDGIFSDFPDRL